MNEQEQILSAVLNCRRIDLYVDSKNLSFDDQQRVDHMTQRRLSGEPLQYIIGYCDFMGSMIRVDDRVLIPRPETEILVDSAIKKLKASQTSRQIRILDLGTGSGNVSIALANNIENSQITSVDISQDAIDLATYNAKANFVEDKIKFICKDMNIFLQQAKEDVKYALIISNPPYIQTTDLDALPQDVQREPRLALDGGNDGLRFYKIILENAFSILEDGGLLMCEIGDQQRQEINTLLGRFPYYNNFECVKDYVGTDRIFSVRKIKNR